MADTHDRQENFKNVHIGGDYDSAFECDSEIEQKRQNRTDLAVTEPNRSTHLVTKEHFHEEWSKEEGRKQRHHLLSLDAYSRHKKLINEYILCYPGQTALLRRDTSKDKTERDVLKEHHKFLWSEEDEATSWESRLAKKYYDKLFKEYCICDLSRYKENKVAMRWRTESEVVNGKGQFSCGAKKCCEKSGLRSWEVNFAYIEDETKKNALVKLRLCPDCSGMLNYKQKRKEIKRLGKKKAKTNKSKDTLSDSDDDPVITEENSVVPIENVASGSSSTEKPDSSQIWKEPLQMVEEKSKDEEFDDYLADMLM